jgi:hypothetical protein
MMPEFKRYFIFINRIVLVVFEGGQGVRGREPKFEGVRE